MAEVNKEIKEERSVKILTQLVEHKPSQGNDYHGNDCDDNWEDSDDDGDDDNRNQVSTKHVKGEVRQNNSLAQKVYRSQTRRSLKTQFLQKSPEVGQKPGQRVQN